MAAARQIRDSSRPTNAQHHLGTGAGQARRGQGPGQGRRHGPVPDQGRRLDRVVRGHLACYTAVPAQSCDRGLPGPGGLALAQGARAPEPGSLPRPCEAGPNERRSVPPAPGLAPLRKGPHRRSDLRGRGRPARSGAGGQRGPIRAVGGRAGSPPRRCDATFGPGEQQGCCSRLPRRRCGARAG